MPVSNVNAPPPSALVALRYRNFQLLWTGQLISLAGTRMQVAAILWHVSLLVEPGRKGIALGLVGLANLIPLLILSPISGVITDARDRRRTLLVTQTCMALLASVLATLTFRGLVQIWPIYLLTSLGAAASAFDGPARQALIPNLVPRKYLPMVFFVGGPQLGELEAGAVAQWCGAVFSVVSGGIGCLLFTAWIAATTPALRSYRREESFTTA